MKTGFRWENDKTKLNATNLNKLNNAIDTNSDAIQVAYGNIGRVEEDVTNLEVTKTATLYGTSSSAASATTKTVTTLDATKKPQVGDTICIKFTNGSETSSIIGPQTLVIGNTNYTIGGFDCDANQYVIFSCEASGTLSLKYKIVLSSGTSVVANPVMSGTESFLGGIEINSTKYIVMSPANATVGQIPIADGSGGFSWTTVPNANGEDF